MVSFKRKFLSSRLKIIKAKSLFIIAAINKKVYIDQTQAQHMKINKADRGKLTKCTNTRPKALCDARQTSRIHS